jgi:hypothetical protein
MTTINQMSFWGALTPVKAPALLLRQEHAMTFRDMPVFHDLRAFARFLEQENWLTRVSQPVRLVHEMTEIHRRVLAAGGPALWFDKAVSNAAPHPCL